MRPISNFTTSALILIYLILIGLVHHNSQSQPQLSQSIINEKDNIQMASIPAGEFWMGSPHEDIENLLKNDKTVSAEFFKSEGPQHLVYLDAFYIDRYEITNGQYRNFIESTKHPKPKYWDDAPNFGSESPFPIGSQNPSHPVVGVSWEDAICIKLRFQPSEIMRSQKSETLVGKGFFALSPLRVD